LFNLLDQTFPKAKRLLETKSELLKPVSFSENEEISQSKIKSFYVENPEKKRSPNSQNSKRKSATPQKSQRSTHENIPKKSEQSKILFNDIFKAI